MSTAYSETGEAEDAGVLRSLGLLELVEAGDADEYRITAAGKRFVNARLPIERNGVVADLVKTAMRFGCERVVNGRAESDELERAALAVFKHKIMEQYK